VCCRVGDGRQVTACRSKNARAERGHMSVLYIKLVCESYLRLSVVSLRRVECASCISPPFPRPLSLKALARKDRGLCGGGSSFGRGWLGPDQPPRPILSGRYPAFHPAPLDQSLVSLLRTSPAIDRGDSRALGLGTYSR